MIRMRLQLLPPDQRVDEVLSALRVLTSRTQVKTGCQGSHVTRGEHETAIVIYEETWRRWEDLEPHIRSKSFRTILELMELSTEKPLLQFEETGEIRGMDFVQKIRKGI